MAAARVAATTVNAEARCGQGASVVAAPGRKRWGPRSAGVDEPDVSRVSVHAVISQGASGSERR